MPINDPEQTRCAVSAGLQAYLKALHTEVGIVSNTDARLEAVMEGIAEGLVEYFRSRPKGRSALRCLALDIITKTEESLK